MSKEIKQRELDVFDRASLEVLNKYSEMLGDGNYFGPSKLEPTPEKPYSARADVSIWLGDRIAKSSLVLILFKPFEGSGDESSFSAKELSFGPRVPHTSSSIPRSKEGVFAEAHIPIAAYNPRELDKPAPFAGNLSEVELREGVVTHAFDLGQNRDDFVVSVNSGRPGVPNATLTTGYVEDLVSLINNGEKFGDPHAITNPYAEVTQMAGFITVKQDSMSEMQILDALGAEPPTLEQESVAA